MSKSFFVVAAVSCRAIARSVRQAGFDCVGVDVFADWDAQKICEVIPAKDLAAMAGLIEKKFPDSLVIRGAGFQVERQPVIDAVQTFGPTLAAVQQARNPFVVAELLNENRFPFLECERGLPAVGSWVQKPYQSAGGLDVKLIESASRSRQRGDALAGGCAEEKPVFFQSYKKGPVYGASFIGDRTGCRLLGVCQQLVERLNENVFTYHGSVGPINLAKPVRETLVRMAELFVKRFELFGWFGIDFVMDEQQPWLLEINPRYTASMEILERQAGQSIFGSHHHAVIGSSSNQAAPRFQTFENVGEALLGKRYVFHRGKRPVRISGDLFEFMTNRPTLEEADGETKFVTDIPHEGSLVSPGFPVCTVWALGDEILEIETRLKELDSAIIQRL